MHSDGPQPSQVAIRLSDAYLFYHRGFKSQKLLMAAVGYMEQLLEDGCTEDGLMAEITRQGRRRTEPIWDFEKRVRAQLQEAPPTLPDGEIDVKLEEWIQFVAAYTAEWPRFGGNYSFLNDWRNSQPFKDATLDELLNAVRAVRANPEQAKHANKFSLLAAAIRSARGAVKAQTRRPGTKPETWVDDGRPDDECTAGQLAVRHGAVKAMSILQERKRAKA